MGGPVRLIYTRSERRAADQMRLQLSRRGWTLAGSLSRQPAPRDSVIRYERAHQRVAFALAHSLRIPVKLERCAGRCGGVTLILGDRGPARPGRRLAANARPLG
jgi:hypothetical protein